MADEDKEKAEKLAAAKKRVCKINITKVGSLAPELLITDSWHIVRRA